MLSQSPETSLSRGRGRLAHRTRQGMRGRPMKVWEAGGGGVDAGRRVGRPSHGGKQAQRPRMAAVWGSSLPTNANRGSTGSTMEPEGTRLRQLQAKDWARPWLTCQAARPPGHELGLPMVCTMEEGEEGALGPGRGCELLRGLG